MFTILKLDDKLLKIFKLNYSIDLNIILTNSKQNHVNDIKLNIKIAPSHVDNSLI